MSHQRTSIPKRLRFEVLKRDSFTCRYCGKRPPEIIIHVDHVEPDALNGPTTMENLVTSCNECNLGKGAIPLKPGALASTGITQAQLDQEEAQLDYLSDLWITMNNEDPAELRVSGDLEDSFLTFIRLLEMPDIVDAMRMAFRRTQYEHARLKYFCGCCWRKIRGDVPQLPNFQKQQRSQHMTTSNQNEAGFTPA